MPVKKKTTKPNPTKKLKTGKAAPATPAEAKPATIIPAVEKADLRGFKPALCIVGASPFSLFGLSTADRLRRQFSREGLATEITEAEGEMHRGPVVLVRADAAIDQPLVQALLKRPNFVLTSEAADGRKPLAGNLRAADAIKFLQAMVSDEQLAVPSILSRAPSEIDANFWKSLRKRETPYALLLTSENQSAVEWRMFMGTYKGATDLVTKHAWPRPAFHVTRWLAARAVTPNMVTSVGAVMTVLAFVLFIYGYYATGLLAAWAMTFLDTVDGKLARTTLTSSKWGDVFDHGIDLVHPPFWYAAWAIGLGTWGVNWSTALLWWVLGAILGGYVVQRLMEGASIKWLGLEIHIWRKIDTLFRQITARRNPNLLILSIATLFAKPDWGLIAVAVWTIVCLVAHGFQLLQAFSARKTENPLVSWMTKP